MARGRKTQEEPPPPPERVGNEWTCPRCPEWRIAYTTADAGDNVANSETWMANGIRHHQEAHDAGEF